MTVLILADEQDPTADLMVRALLERDATVDRIDTAWFPAQLSFHAELSGERWSGQLHTPHRTVDLDAITAIWYRSPNTFRFPSAMSPVERQHALVETKLGLGGVLASLDVLWGNHPNRVADAAYKPVQLAIAARCGLTVPTTLITSEQDAVRHFARDPASPVVTTMLGAATLSEESRRKAAYTRRVSPESLVDLRGVEVAAHQFQHWVPKAFDARLIIIGEELFGFAIHADSAAAHLDFRRDYPALRYQLVDVPSAVRDGVAKFMSASDLVYGAMDFVVTHQGEWVFLENNAGGQYGWLEGHTGAPLTATLADLLAQGGHS